MTTKYEEQMYNDIHRIANALEKIAKIFEPPKIVVNEMNEEEKEKYLEQLKNNKIIPNVVGSKPNGFCPRCGSNDICIMYVTSRPCDCEITHYMCLNCHKEFDV